jgi:hydroxymethylpyrimidine pyrophosphatase-like HAD family hydrolase
VSATGVRRSPAVPSEAEPVDPVLSRQPAHDLLLDFARLRHRFLEIVDSAPADVLTHPQLVDAFLLAGGLHQVIEDYVHGGGDLVGRAAKRLGAIGNPLAGIAAAAGDQLSAARWNQQRRRQTRRLGSLRTALDEAVLRLARALIVAADRPGKSPDSTSVHLEDIASQLRDAVPTALARQLVKLPTCYRSLDQLPADCLLMAGALAGDGVPTGTPLLVLGLRTSGSYLGPLLHASLERAGFDRVDSTTARPRQPWSPEHMDKLARIAEGGGKCLVIDDPPKRGRAMVDVTSRLEDLGLAPESIVLMLPVIDPRPLQRPELAVYPAYTLGRRDWTIQRQLQPEPVRAALRPMLEGNLVTLLEGGAAPRTVEVAEVDKVKRLPLPASVGVGEYARRHLAALYRVSIRTVDGEAVEHSVYVKGTGMGYLGRHSVDVVTALEGLVPDVYGVSGGLMYRAWIPEEWRVTSPTPGLALSVARYAAARRERLAVDEDVSLRLVGGGPVWKLAAARLERAFGRAAPAFRRINFEVACRLTLADHPAVWDGSMALANWAEVKGSGDHLKVDFDERAFANQDSVGDEMYCYDVDADVAATAADALRSAPRDPERLAFADSLRVAYEAEIGAPVGEEKWLLYQLVWLQHQRELVTEGLDDADAAELDVPRLWRELLDLEAAMAQVHQRYYSATFFADLGPVTMGRLCAIDIDGVLETLQLSFPAITPAGADALRRLHRHGFRTVLATGRSLSDVVARCKAYGAAGGVAEYGASIYDAASGATELLVSDAQAAELKALRGVLRELIDVELDPDYTGVIRAYRRGRHGNRHRLSDEVVDAALAMLPAGEPMTIVHGGQQTDFVPAGVDKGAGIRVLAERLDATGAEQPLAMACGDAFTDIPMMAEAGVAYAPANADALLRRAGGFRLMERPCQAGLLEAVDDFLGHTPGPCPDCSPPEWTSETRLLLAVFAAQDVGAAAKARQAMSVARLLGGRRLI